METDDRELISLSFQKGPVQRLIRGYQGGWAFTENQLPHPLLPLLE